MRKRRDTISSDFAAPSASIAISDILGCKWTVVVLRNIAVGVNRPGALTKQIAGLSTKVLNERVKKLVRYRIITKSVFNELPPRVEYRLTALGQKIIRVLAELDKIDLSLAHEPRGKAN